MRTDELARDQAATAPILRGRAGARARSHNPSRPLRVMHLLWGLGPYGMENGVINICHGLRPDEFTMSIGVFTPGQSAEARVDRKLVSLHGIPRRHGKDLTVPIRLARLHHAHRRSDRRSTGAVPRRDPR